MRRLLSVLSLTLVVTVVSAQSLPIFETVFDSGQSLSQTVDQVQFRLTTAGFQLLSTRDAGTDAECEGDVRVISAWLPGAMDPLFNLNPITAPYALVDRVAIFEDEDGVHVATIHAGSLWRTVLLDHPRASTLAASHRDALRSALGAEAARGFGQSRTEGLIGKTMGVMAGGSFDGKLGNVVELDGTSVQAVADAIASRFDAASGDWGMQIAWRVDLADRDMAIFGVTSSSMEAKSFSIVGAGSDESRENLACPGTAYAAAYPIELVVRKQDGRVVVETVDAMFRMKMFFEDAGKWAFMKNMTMPGSLASEIKARVEFAIGQMAL